MAAWDGSGGILELTELVHGERRPELTRDFRERFHISLEQVGLSVPYDEARDLIRSLMRDPASWFHAAVAGWDHPFSREAMVSADLYDLQLRVALKNKQNRFKPYPRPWPDKNKTRFGGSNKKKRTLSEVLKILRPNR